jgi:dephospho-CoA kinase
VIAPPGRSFLLVGLTGGIATGKSTVAAMFRALGCEVVDADQLAREVVEPGEPALDEIVAEFGPEVLRPDGRLDRKALGAVVFSDPARRRRLEAILHPRIRQRLAERLAALAAAGFRGLVVFDAALLVETGAAALMDRLVVVVADEATQLARLMARDGLSREEAQQRLRSQLPLADKVRHAHYVIDNSGDRAATAAQVREVYRALRAELERRTVAP